MEGLVNYDTEFEIRDSGNSAIEYAGHGALRVALLFGSAAVALAIVLTPILNRVASDNIATAQKGDGVDPIVTGTTKKSDAYRIRRSVLQDASHEPCVIYADGRSAGSC